MPWAGVMSQFIVQVGRQHLSRQDLRDYENENIQSRNIDAAQIALGVKGGGGSPATDLNRLHSYHDLNGDVGGFIKKDKLWWYSSLRDQDAQSLLPNFPVKPFETRLRNVTGKGTYAVTPTTNWWRSRSGGRSSSRTGSTRFWWARRSPIHNSADSTWNQSYWAHTYKVGWDSVVNDKMFFEVHGGQFHYLWPNTRNSNAPAYEDLSTNIVSGGNQDGWFRDITRNQVSDRSTTSRKAGPAPQLQVRRRVLQRAVRRPPRTGRQGPGSRRRADGLAKRRPVGSGALPVAHRRR